MSIYTIDVGNTRIKVAQFEDGKLVQKKSFQLLEAFYLYYDTQKVEKSILSSVRNLHWRSSSQTVPLLLNQSTTLPFENLYRTKETLGNDRKALVSGAVKLFPNQNCLIIDAGTCITYDFVNAKKQYFGGSISPGYAMRYRALNQYTSKLPLVEIEKENIELMGGSTIASIKSGVYYGMLSEIAGFIEQYSKKHTNLTTILTGGDAKYFEKHLKARIFAIPDLQMEGLYHILEQND